VSKTDKTQEREEAAMKLSKSGRPTVGRRTILKTAAGLVGAAAVPAVLRQRAAALVPPMPASWSVWCPRST